MAGLRLTDLEPGSAYLYRGTERVVFLRLEPSPGRHGKAPLVRFPDGRNVLVLMRSLSRLTQERRVVPWKVKVGDTILIPEPCVVVYVERTWNRIIWDRVWRIHFKRRHDPVLGNVIESRVFGRRGRVPLLHRFAPE